MTRPKPQFSQQQMVDTNVVTRMACLSLWQRAATARSAFLQGRAEAIAEPNTSTSAICMEKASRFQKPPLASPHLAMTSTGPMPVAHMAATNTIRVRMMANRNASGSHRFTTRTHPLVNFLNITSLSFTTHKLAGYRHSIFPFGP